MQEALADLRHRSLVATTPLYSGSEAARQQLSREWARPLLEGQGVVRTLERQGRLLALVALWRNTTHWSGQPSQELEIELEDSDEAQAWVLRTLADLAPRFTDELTATVLARRRPIWQALLGLGLHIDSVVLVGRTEPSLDALVARYDPPRSLDHLGLRLEPFEPRHIEPILDLWREVFRDSPYCWFGSNRHYLESLRADMERGNEATWCVMEGDVLLGQLRCEFELTNAFWGRKGGVGLTMHERVQRKGIAKTAYRLMLEAMRDQDVGVYVGGTAQPAVMGLGRLMGRETFRVNLRQVQTFPPSHFSLVLG